MLTHGFNRLHRGLKVARVVQGVKDTENGDANFGGVVHECFHHVIGVIAVAHQVLPAEKHLQGRVRHQFLQDAGPFPGVLVEVARGHVKGGAAPDLHGEETDLVHLLGDGFHVRSAHTRGVE